MTRVFKVFPSPCVKPVRFYPEAVYPHEDLCVASWYLLTLGARGAIEDAFGVCRLAAARLVAITVGSGMANEEQLAWLRQGVVAWNGWRRSNRDKQIDLGRADLSRADLRSANLSGANLNCVLLTDTNLSDANLSNALLFFTNLRDALNLEPLHLEAKPSPFLCNVALPAYAQQPDVNHNRACSRMPQLLSARYDISLEEAQAIVEEARQHHWD